MRNAPFDAIDPMEARLAGRVHDWLDQAVVPIDAAAIARSASAPRARRGPLSGTSPFFARRLLAGIAVLALGMSALLLVPGQAPSTAPGAMPSPSVEPSMRPEPFRIATPVEFTGSFQLSDCGGRSMDVVGGESYARGAVCPISILEASDPRLIGGGEVRVDRDPHAGGYALSMVAHRIENDGGAWQEIPEPRHRAPRRANVHEDDHPAWRGRLRRLDRRGRAVTRGTDLGRPRLHHRGRAADAKPLRGSRRADRLAGCGIPGTRRRARTIRPRRRGDVRGADGLTRLDPDPASP